MVDAPFLDGGQGEVRGRNLRSRAFAAFVVLTAVSTEMQAAAQAPREARRDAPRVLVPVESNVAVARVQARTYFLRTAGDILLIYLLDGPEWPKGAPRQDRKLKAIPLKRLSEEPNARPAEQAFPLRAAIIAASFPFRAEVEEFRAKLKLANAEAVLSEHRPDGAPTFRFLGVRVQRRTLGPASKPLTPYTDLDLADAYKPYLLLSGKNFEPEQPPALEQVIVPGLVMPKLLLFPPHEYPQVEAGLKTLRNALEQLSKPTAPPAPNVPEKEERDRRPAPKAEAEVPPGIAKPRPEPFPPGIAKPRKAPPAKPTRPKAVPARVGMPEYCLLRVLDPTVQPGRVYQYRLQVRMANPNYGRKDVAVPALAEGREIDSGWYEVPQKVVVSPDLLYYAVDQKELEGAKHYKGLNRDAWVNKDRTALQIHCWLEGFFMHTDRKMLSVGEWVVAERVIAYRGEYVGFDQRIEFPYWRTNQEQFVVAREELSFRPERPDGRDTVLVDFEGGYQDYSQELRGPGFAGTRKVRDSSAPGLLLLTPDGKLLAPEGARDARDQERKERLAVVRQRLAELKK
jgi:hypothetical protein